MRIPVNPPFRRLTTVPEPFTHGGAFSCVYLELIGLIGADLLIVSCLFKRSIISKLFHRTQSICDFTQSGERDSSLQTALR